MIELVPGLSIILVLWLVSRVLQLLLIMVPVRLRMLHAEPRVPGSGFRIVCVVRNDGRCGLIPLGKTPLSICRCLRQSPH